MFKNNKNKLLMTLRGSEKTYLVNVKILLIVVHVFSEATESFVTFATVPGATSALVLPASAVGSAMKCPIFSGRGLTFLQVIYKSFDYDLKQ